MEEYSYTSTHPLGHTGPVTASLYLTFYMNIVSTPPEVYYRLWYVVVCDLETLGMRRPGTALGNSVAKKKYIYI